jgi:hypothetical protein
LNGQIEPFDEIEGKPVRKAKTCDLRVEYFAAFICRLRETANAAGCHIKPVGFEKTVKLGQLRQPMLLSTSLSSRKWCELIGIIALWNALGSDERPDRKESLRAGGDDDQNAHFE